LKLITIAQDDSIRNSAHEQNLPVNWTILYELTKLTEEQFDNGRSGQIDTDRLGLACRGVGSDLKRDGLVFSDLVAFAQSAHVEKHIAAAVIGRDKTKSAKLVEHLNFSECHLMSAFPIV
jgi:hypothetical protein